MEHTAIRQITGDYEIRFSERGGNKREIVTRFLRFLLAFIAQQPANATIAVFSHGRAISILEHEFAEITGEKSFHARTTNASVNKITLREKHEKIIREGLRKLENAG